MQIIHRTRPLIYLYHPVNYYGVSKKVDGVQIYGDGLIRAAVRRLQEVARRVRTIMGGFLLRKVGAALDRAAAREHARLRSACARCRATRRSRSAARTATRRCSPRSGTTTGSTSRCRCSTCNGSGSRVRGDLGTDQRELPVAHTIVHAAADHARARRPRDPDRVGDRHPRRGHRRGAARQGVATTPRRRSRSSGSRCRTSGSAC